MCFVLNHFKKNIECNFINFIRIEYDAYRMDLENSKPDSSAAAAPAVAAPINAVVSEETQKNFDKHRETYEKLRADVAVKMQFLDENRVSSWCRYIKVKNPK